MVLIVKHEYLKGCAGRPHASWSDDLRMTAGSNSMQEAEDRTKCRIIGEAYVKHWTAIGCCDDNGDDHGI